ncbi:hypothetical protein HOE425_331318 [Hoeflea sp. EC-HK425]|nr:hypothetical protein HOE425_331318 [Hoeflea sp. EC-HK425]
MAYAFRMHQTRDTPHPYVRGAAAKNTIFIFLSHGAIP